MVLLRRVIGDALRARRQGQHRTLREVSTAANVSLGYLSEVERGQKEASSELLGSICEALGAQLSDVLREVSDTLALAEQVEGVLVPVPETVPPTEESGRVTPEPAAKASVPSRGPRVDASVRRVATDGKVSISIHQDSPLKATLRAKRTAPAARERDVVFAA